MKRALLALVLVVSGCARCRTDQVAPDEQKKAKAPINNEAVRLCLEGVRGLSRYSDRCEHSSLWWGSVERAVEQLHPACERLVVAPGARFDKKEIDACNAALDKHPCFQPLPAECRIGGSLKAGDACAFGAQCGPGLICRQPQGKICGTCVPSAKGGESCVDIPCDESLVCIAEKCSVPVPAGGACSSPYDCQRPLFCDFKSPTSGVCAQPRREGEPCTSIDCEPQLRCTDGRCVKRGPPQGPGADCADSLDCLDYACVHGKCGSFLHAGQKCSEESAPCAPSYMCIPTGESGGKCVLPDARDCK